MNEFNYKKNYFYSLEIIVFKIYLVLLMFVIFIIDDRYHQAMFAMQLICIFLINNYLRFMETTDLKS